MVTQDLSRVPNIKNITPSGFSVPVTTPLGLAFREQPVAICCVKTVGEWEAGTALRIRVAIDPNQRFRLMLEGIRA